MQTCARFSVNPGPLHWEEAVLRIIRYLKGTAGYGIVYRRSMRDSLNVDETVIPENWSIEENHVNHPEFKLMTISRGLCLYAYVDADHAKETLILEDLLLPMFSILVILRFVGNPSYNSVWLHRVCNLNTWHCVLHVFNLFGL